MAPSPQIVAFAGPPGAGKSALIAALRIRFPDAAAIAADDFPSPSAMPIAALGKWMAGGGDFGALDISVFRDALAGLKAGRDAIVPGSGVRIATAGLILAEAPLGRAHPTIAPLIDRLVWIDTPLDVALARNLVAWRGAGGPPQGWIDAYVDNYLAVTRRVLAAQRALVMPGADLVLGGMEEVAALADQVTAWL